MTNYENLKPTRKRILVDEIESGEQLQGSIIVLDDDAKTRGIKSRWCHIYAISPEIEDLKVGDWILVEHGRWSRGFKASLEDRDVNFRFVEYEYVQGVSETKPGQFNTI